MILHYLKKIIITFRKKKFTHQSDFKHPFSQILKKRLLRRILPVRRLESSRGFDDLGDALRLLKAKIGRWATGRRRRR